MVNKTIEMMKIKYAKATCFHMPKQKRAIRRYASQHRTDKNIVVIILRHMHDL